MESLKSRLLTHYGLREEDYPSFVIEPSYSLIPTIENEAAAIEAKKVLMASIAAKHDILIYGDYDTDGIMATSIMKRTLALMGVEAKTFIPSRYHDGYGLTLDNAKRIAEKGFGLVILVDNGVSCFEQVSYLRERSINVIVIDHHDLPASLPPANAIIHDELLKYGEAAVSAGFLCYLFSRVLLGKNDPYLFTLGALSLLSDIMPMKAQNRVAVGLMLREIRQHEFPEIMMLTSQKLIDEKILGLDVIPKINSIPRIKEGNEVNLLVPYFASLEAKDKFKVAEWMAKTNEERKALIKAGFEKLYLTEAPGYCIKSDNPEGLNGLIANKVLDKWNAPAIVFSPSSAHPGCLVGSFRSKEGAEMPSLIEALGDIPVQSGGHAYAGGITIKEGDFMKVHSIMEEWAKAHPFVKKKEQPIELLLEEANMDTYKEIRKFGPFGEGHREPVFLIRNVPLAGLRIIKEERPFKALANLTKVCLKSFRFGKDAISAPSFDIKGTFGINEFRERRTFEFTCELAKDED
ncbi:MAG: DHH family phosphoesterase [Bacilli bacterium]|nr:DHH family phosphoesterase [Bacilli bacterium]